MSSSNPSSSSLANSVKRPSTGSSTKPPGSGTKPPGSGTRPPGSSPPDVKKVVRPDGSSRPMTSSGKVQTSSAVRTPTSSAARPESSKLVGHGKDGQGSKGKPTMGTPSASRPLEKPKTPVQGVKKEEPGLKEKGVVRSVEVKSSVSTSSSKPINAVSKSEVKTKTPASTSKTDPKSTKTTRKTGTRGKTEKKVYSLPGQKHDPPEEREPLRIFYESLSKQIPTSEMAEIWMMEHGLLSPEKAKKAYERKQKKQHQVKTGTPVKSATKLNRPESSKKPQSINNGDMKAKKRVSYSDDDDDDDFIFKKKFKA